jgi:hypothetical protein
MDDHVVPDSSIRLGGPPPKEPRGNEGVASHLHRNNRLARRKWSTKSFDHIPGAQARDYLTRWAHRGHGIADRAAGREQIRPSIPSNTSKQLKCFCRQRGSNLPRPSPIVEGSGATHEGLGCVKRSEKARLSRVIGAHEDVHAAHGTEEVRTFGRVKLVLRPFAQGVVVGQVDVGALRVALGAVRRVVHGRSCFIPAAHGAI